MQRDDVRLPACQSAESTITKRHVTMRCPVKSVAPDPVPPVQVIGNCVEISLLGQRMMKCCIENGDLRNIFTEKIASRQNALHIIWIMQRRQVDTVIDSFEHSIVD